jgi:hypothetical protein
VWRSAIAKSASKQKKILHQLLRRFNRDEIVLFSPVRDPRKYLNWEAVEKGDYEKVLEPSSYMSLVQEHYLFSEKNPLREDFITTLVFQT